MGPVADTFRSHGAMRYPYPSRAPPVGVFAPPRARGHDGGARGRHCIRDGY